MQKYKDKPRETNLLFFGGLLACFSIMRRRYQPMPRVGYDAATADARYTTILPNARKDDVLEKGEVGN